MANDLTLISSDVLTTEEADALETAIQQVIARQRNNRTELNRLVFESIEAMTEAQDAQAALKNKTGLRRLIGSLTGSNKALQDKINESHAAMQYAGQQMLKALDEQNVMTFELITAVSNKLNAMKKETEADLTNIYDGLRKFVNFNRGNLAQIATRLDRVEQNQRLTTWSLSIEILPVDDGRQYADLDDAGKIVYMARDFYELTKGNWSTSDLLLLKGTMNNLELNPRKEVNYFQILQGIGNSPMYLEKLFAGEKLPQIEDPSYLISMGTIGKIASLQGKESYIVDAVSSYLPTENTADKRNEIVGDLAKKYINGRTGVNVDTEITTYDLMLDLLYSLKQVEAEGLLGNGQVETDVPEGSDAPETLNESPVTQKPAPTVVEGEKTKSEKEPDPKKDWEEDAIQYFMHFQMKEAIRAFSVWKYPQSERAKYFLGEIYDWGLPYNSNNKDFAQKYRESGAAMGDPLCCLKQVDIVAFDEETKRAEIEAMERVKALADEGDIFAQYEYGSYLCYDYYESEGEEAYWNLTPEERERYLSASADAGWAPAMCALGRIYENSGREKAAFELYEKAGNLGYGAAWYEMTTSTDNNSAKMRFLLKAYNSKQGIAGLAAFLIGQIYQDDWQDDKSAIKWFQTSISLGEPRGYFPLGEAYASGRGVREDIGQAMFYYQRAYEEYSPVAGEAANRLGVLHSRNDDHDRANKWFQKAVDQGFDWGYVNLAESYACGLGGRKDIDQAIALWQQAYELDGYAAGEAAHKLAVVYRAQGNYDAARKWDVNAKEHGYEEN